MNILKGGYQMNLSNKYQIGNLVGEVIRVEDQYITLEFPGSFEQKQVDGRYLEYYIPRQATYHIDYFNKLKGYFNEK